MEEKDRLERITKLKKDLTSAQNSLQQLRQAAGRTEAMIVDMAARIDELENKRWEEKKPGDVHK